MDDQSFDAVVTTWTLCSVSDIAVALREMQRVLKPGGTLVFAEHGTAPNIAVRTWQDRLTPLWKRIAGGCHLNRKPDRELRAAGFRIDGLETRYIRGWRPFTFMYEGQASVPLQDATIISRSEEHTSELQSLMRISYAVFCLQQKNSITRSTH